ncbi:MAG: tRNA uridine-5-carboxymethylaminomethyl(34) synthesis GTPase MnmE [Chloroflexaceae bacterium]|jgi:tRNA modification GTPase|nr:tRNA uridine-5-carboxymethylaminomethyl(34) synthesis GTPase MnmE [Chloroflexaceae bacterium]
MYDDTIAAIATPPGEGGIGVVRLSGREALSIANQIFRPLRPGPLRPYRLRYGHVVEVDGTVVDEALAAYMRAPRSFTCEDVVEFSCHGGPLPVQRTLGLALAAGARLAKPGEFTMRAFLNGRIDLTQAEATLDIIRAQTATGLALAQAQLGGWLAHEVRRIRTDLLEALAYVTVVVDFPEDEVESQDVTPNLSRNLAAVERLLASADQGVVYRQGARVALVGRPNVGKSSLLNALLRADRAIVTPIAGTTRDTLEETANLGGIPVVLIDTAGITESADPVERLGVERSRAALAGADLALLVFDSQRPPEADDMQIAALTLEKPTILVWNKDDTQEPRTGEPRTGQLENRACPERSRREPGTENRMTAEGRIEEPIIAVSSCHSSLAGGSGFSVPGSTLHHPRLIATVATSALTGAGIDELAQSVAQALLGGHAPTAGEAHLVSNPRHRDALERAVTHLRAAMQSRSLAVPTDLLAGDLTTALNALGEITGETVGDDLLDVIFSRFCIGK